MLAKAFYTPVACENGSFVKHFLAEINLPGLAFRYLLQFFSTASMSQSFVRAGFFPSRMRKNPISVIRSNNQPSRNRLMFVEP